MCQNFANWQDNKANRFRNIASRFADLQIDVAELRRAFADLQSDVAELRRAFADLQIDVAELQRAFADLQSDRAELQSASLVCLGFSQFRSMVLLTGQRISQHCKKADKTSSEALPVWNV